ncbi:hypothetical protein CMV30_07895 [Nibricoccus aquaticus]|uniref:Uncharacterized protein n=2 Tax=Nibricoccus aquaticus TaxID=2576891 RepID=A0A290Q5B7_9BACT|nr:hypothetical protein CMV30_07895 [Nibricoccus aquaticus]
MPIAPMPASGPVAIPTGGVGPRPQGKLVAQTDEKAVARGKFAVKLLGALLFVAAGLFGVVAYNLWFSDEPVPAVVVAKPAPAPATSDVPVVAPAEAGTAPAVVETTPAGTTVPAVATPAATGPVVVDNPQSLPGQLIAKAQNAVSAHEAAMTQPANEVMDTGSSSLPAAVTPAVPAPAAVVEVKPVPVPEPVAAPRPEPGANFKAFVVNLKINGVFQGENARAMLNNKMYRLGETVDAKLGIVFLRLEPEEKRIVFEDSRGAIMSRRY